MDFPWGLTTASGCTSASILALKHTGIPPMELTYLMTFHSNFGLETAKNGTAITQNSRHEMCHRPQSFA